MWRSFGRCWLVTSTYFCRASRDMSRTESIGVGEPSPLSIESWSTLGASEDRECAPRGLVEALPRSDRVRCRDACRIVGVWLGLAVVQPSHHVKTFGVELLSPGISRQGLQQRRSRGDEVLNKRWVRSVNLSELVEVLLDVALASKNRVDVGILIRSLAQQSRLYDRATSSFFSTIPGRLAATAWTSLPRRKERSNSWVTSFRTSSHEPGRGLVIQSELIGGLG
ncbi:hypothetical protein KC335_g89 [Hortaea werneckii]|nr:hypothetical protein KC335_g89 [Hortaea werneckii]